MYIEDQINELTFKIQDLTDKMDLLGHSEKWVSAKELAEIMGCSLSTVYLKIRSGEIYASKRLGTPRIPLSQFYEEKDQQPEKPKKERSIAERVFN